MPLLLTHYIYRKDAEINHTTDAPRTVDEDLFVFLPVFLAGGCATSIYPTPWLVLMTFLLALFLAFAKRRDDVVIYTKTGEGIDRLLHHVYPHRRRHAALPFPVCLSHFFLGLSGYHQVFADNDCRCEERQSDKGVAQKPLHPDVYPWLDSLFLLPHLYRLNQSPNPSSPGRSSPPRRSPTTHSRLSPPCR